MKSLSGADAIQVVRLVLRCKVKRDITRNSFEVSDPIFRPSLGEYLWQVRGCQRPMWHTSIGTRFLEYEELSSCAVVKLEP